MSLVVFNLKLRNTNTQSIGNVEYDMPAGNFNSNMSLYPTPDINSSFYAYTNNLLKSLNRINSNIYSKPKTISIPSIKITNDNNNNKFNISAKSTTLNKPSATLQNADYNENAGKNLARIASNSATGFNGQCATYVKQAIQNAGLGEYETGDAYQCADILERNKNFKEISTAGLSLSSLPAGCVLVYDKGVSGYNSQYGHTEITLGNGQAVSDGITNNIRQGARVFVPVSNEYLA